MYGGNLLASANAPSTMVAYILALPEVVITADFAHHEQYNFTAYQSMLVFYGQFLCCLCCSCSFFRSYIMPKSSRLLLKVCWQFLTKQSSMKRESFALHLMYVSNCDDLDQMIQEVVWFGRFLCCIFYCFVCNRYSIISLPVHNFTNFLF